MYYIVAAPFMGAWIEIYNVRYKITYNAAAPFMGAWIEIHGTGKPRQ